MIKETCWIPKKTNVLEREIIVLVVRNRERSYANISESIVLH